MLSLVLNNFVGLKCRLLTVRGWAGDVRSIDLFSCGRPEKPAIGGQQPDPGEKLTKSWSLRSLVSVLRRRERWATKAIKRLFHQDGIWNLTAALGNSKKSSSIFISYLLLQLLHQPLHEDHKLGGPEGALQGDWETHGEGQQGEWGASRYIFLLLKILPTLLGGGASPKLTSGKHAEGAWGRTARHQVSKFSVTQTHKRWTIGLWRTSKK